MGTCLGVRDGFSQPSTSTSNLHLYLLSRNKKSEPFQLILYVLTATCLVGFLVTFFFFSPQSDQIDENLKLALQQDLTTMAPGLIIQVIRIPL